MLFLFFLTLLLLTIFISALLTALIWAFPLFRQLIQQYEQSSFSHLYDQYKAVFEFLNCDSFNNIFEAVNKLVDYEPTHAAAIVLSFEPHLNRLKRDAMNIGGKTWIAFYKATENWVQYIMTVAPVSWIKDLWKEANHSLDQIWLFDLIINNRAKTISPIEYKKPNEIIIKCDKNRLHLKVSDKEKETRKRIVSIFANEELRKWSLDQNDFVNKNFIPQEYIYLAKEKIRKSTLDYKDIEKCILEKIQEKKTTGILIENVVRKFSY